MCELLELGLGFSPELTVYENVTLYAAVLGYPRRDGQARVERAIAFAELERFRDAKLKSLSTGMVMRLGFATALQADSDVILLDESSPSGTRNSSASVWLPSSSSQRHKTVVLVSHDLSDVRQFCDRVVLFDAGRVVATGAPDAVIPRYLHLIGTAASPEAAAVE